MKEAKEYHKVIKKAKKIFYRNKIRKERTRKIILSIKRWHKSTGTFRSIPLKDKLYPDNPPATTTSEKKEILILNLITKHTEAGDIPIDTAKVSRSSFYFPEISKEEVREIMLRAGNTAPGKDEGLTAILQYAWPPIE